MRLASPSVLVNMSVGRVRAFCARSRHIICASQGQMDYAFFPGMLFGPRAADWV
jgi:hypothetical protein